MGGGRAVGLTVCPGGGGCQSCWADVEVRGWVAQSGLEGWRAAGDATLTNRLTATSHD